MNNNIVNIFEKVAQDLPNKIALIEKDRSVSFGELQILVSQCAGRYSNKGIKKGTHALVLIPMSIDLYVNVLALFKLGATVVFTDEWVNKKRLSTCIDIVGVDVLISSTKGYLYSFVHSGLSQISKKIVYRKSSALYEGSVEIETSTSALVTFTTGSTGIPKAANRTHKFLTSQYDELSTLLNPIKGGGCMTTLPIIALCCIGLGITTVLPKYNHKQPSKTNITDLNNQINKYNIQSIIGSPYLIHQLCSVSDSISKALDNIFVGGAAVFHADAKKWIAHFPKSKIEIIYGSTEAEPIAQISAQALLENASNSQGVCVGEVNNHLALKIINIDVDAVSIDHMEELKDGEVGEVIVAGDHVLKTYINSPDAFKLNKIVDGDKLWHRTGDAGYLKDNQLYLVGRASQMITIKGESIGIFIVEEQLANINGIDYGTIIAKDGKQQVIINGVFTYETKQQIQNLFGIDNIRTDIKIPMDPRHHSKIDYGKLHSIV